MDLKKRENKEVLQRSISSLAKEYEDFLVDLTNGNDKDYHKAAILYYWLKEYKNLLKREPNFNPSYLKSYKRGDIVQVNFGFNLGNEYGGRHYALVVEDNDRSSGVVTVIPLRSMKAKDSNNSFEYDVDLGDELFIQFNQKIQREILNVQQNNKEIEASIQAINQNDDALKNAFDAITSIEENAENRNIEMLLTQLSETQKRNAEERKVLCSKLDKGIKSLDALTNARNQFLKMKHGSIAIVKQITTISKMRILNPIKDTDAFAGIRLSPRKLNDIDNKIKEFYTYK